MSTNAWLNFLTSQLVKFGPCGLVDPSKTGWIGLRARVKIFDLSFCIHLYDAKWRTGNYDSWCGYGQVWVRACFSRMPTVDKIGIESAFWLWVTHSSHDTILLHVPLPIPIYGQWCHWYPDNTDACQRTLLALFPHFTVSIHATIGTTFWWTDPHIKLIKQHITWVNNWHVLNKEDGHIGSMHLKFDTYPIRPHSLWVGYRSILFFLQIPSGRQFPITVDWFEYLLLADICNFTIMKSHRCQKLWVIDRITERPRGWAEICYVPEVV